MEPAPAMEVSHDEKDQKSRFHALFRVLPRPVVRKATFIIVALAVANALIWVAAFICYRPYPTAQATLLLAWTLGLRHAVDADHIAAIDNVTRKLSQDDNGRTYPCTVGFWFALGHSTIVIVATVVLAVTARGLSDSGWGITGTIVSATFLFLIAACNIVVLVGIIRNMKRMRNGGNLAHVENDEILKTGGFLGRFFRPVFKFINAPWKMYPLGILFGIGFDTATEITLLGISATQAGTGIPLGLVLFLPALFTAGMTFIDTLDGIVMLATYRYAMVNPALKLYYNFVITLLSVLVAIFVGTIEVLSIIAEKYDMTGGFWDAIRKVDEEFGIVGYVVITTFVVVTLVAIVVYRLGTYSSERILVVPPSLEEGTIVDSDQYSHVGRSAPSAIIEHEELAVAKHR
ncbi:Ni2+-Co2+ transporter (NiCoT) family transition metal uptake transporter [Spizellomyces punctatus DAOM BR117]|uniref:Nickel/cobalt efflux system n=1 Tax=Spizellomyces punctatus (strain DAOM BR117) TaxID=645134 RepID=A0A0L0HAG3_SPIPD|nr:Ni2+-Co2+ transporter (NiCoT) family transition metal uptake transporter [Spizellomyces punctatus DAOM BR117]KNC97996.1 Ni2+-Co2+ transporter (NiCoT) family transition metal uptake transporter [Spizellomyces punctatus DAOM BR117]|eukprot:XP_016606036.1 Ni2+-Co2+ transporter (NiCoT) family transition metal uptake transporter [Spizellomyces punctatus DAOM BR117]